MTQPKLSPTFKKMPLTGLGKCSGSDKIPPLSEDTSQRLGADPIDLSNANALIVYLAGKTLTTLRPLTLIDTDTEKRSTFPAETEFLLCKRQPLHRRPVWQELDPETRVNMEYRGRPVLLTLECFHNVFCLGPGEEFWI